MSKLLKQVCSLHSGATPICRKYPAVKKAPVGTVHLGDELYIDSGSVVHKLVGNKLVEIPYCSNGVEVIITPPLGEVSNVGIIGYYEGQPE